MLDKVCSTCYMVYTSGTIGGCPRCQVEQFTHKEVDTSPVVFDEIKRVSYYQVFPEYGIEARHIIERLVDLSGYQGIKAVWYANSLKYMLRMNRKGDPVKDRGKVKEYLGYMEE